MYPYQHDAERRMTEYANAASSKFRVQGSKSEADASLEPGTLNFELIRRMLNQMARELLLAQSSDWAFQIYQGTTVEYSSRRFQSHIHRFNLLAEMLDTGELSEHQLSLLAEIENRDTIFQEIDYRVYCTRATSASAR